MRASHRKSPTNKHPEASSVNAVASSDIRRQLLPLQLVTSLPEWTGTLGHLGHLTKRNYIKGGIPNFSNHRSHVFFHVPFRVEGWGMSRHLMVFYVCRHGIDRNASSLVPWQEPWKDDEFANQKKGKHWWLLTLFEKVIASSSPSIDWRRVGSTYVFTFSKGPTGHQKIKMQFNPTGFCCQRLHCKLAEHQAKAYDFESLFWVPSNLFPLQELYPPGN